MIFDGQTKITLILSVVNTAPYWL